MIDVAIALQNLVVAATMLGLGTCWIGDFEESVVKELLRIPDEWRVVSLIAVGYPDETPELPRKKPLDIVTSLNFFDEPFIKGKEK
ncbi:MAG: nitroreductase family protein [Candidatus Asgardarchaeia archaeon]